MSTQNTSLTFKVNKAARLLRHRRLFEKYSVLSYALKQMSRTWDTIVEAGTKIVPTFQKRFSPLIHFQQKTQIKESIITPRSIQNRIAAISVGLFIMTGFMVNGYDVSAANEGLIASEDLNYIVDQEGYFAKANPVTFDGQRVAKDKILHIVEEGENISLIASRYGLKTDTLLWENSLSLSSTLQIGQKLLVPPVDGVSYTVTGGDTVEKIAAKYKVDAKNILAYNNIPSGVIAKNQVIFLPNAKPLPMDARLMARALSRDATSRSGSLSRLSPSGAKPSVGKFMIFPTIGVFTQGFNRGHFGYDIANRSKPPIWAAAAGTVVKASSGTWGGGYGNHVIIDHGNGVQTLYAHMDYLSVKSGDKVKQGDVIGRMGNTGRVRGATGIHLHFEVIDNGVKRIPANYY